MSESATTTIFTKFFAPSDSAFHTATLSAQTVRENVAFSILHPVYVVPSAASSAAPTLKPENGATARSLASTALFARSPTFSSYKLLRYFGIECFKSISLNNDRISHNIVRENETNVNVAARL